MIVTLLAIGFVGWYAVGSLYNRRRSNVMLRRVWRALRIFKAPGEMESLGSSGFIVALRKPTRHFRALSISLTLEKRELPVNWFVDLLRGKRDTLTVKVALKSPIPVNAEVYRPKSYFGGIAERLSRKLGFQLRRRGEVTLAFEAYNGFLESILRFVARNREIWWVSVRRDGGILIINSHASIIDRLDRLLQFLESLNASLKAQQ